MSDLYECIVTYSAQVHYITYFVGVHCLITGVYSLLDELGLYGMCECIVSHNLYEYIVLFQVIGSNILGEQGLPGVFVLYELSPMMVKYTEKHRSVASHWMAFKIGNVIDWHKSV